MCDYIVEVVEFWNLDRFSRILPAWLDRDHPRLMHETDQTKQSLRVSATIQSSRAETRRTWSEQHKSTKAPKGSRLRSAARPSTALSLKCE